MTTGLITISADAAAYRTFMRGFGNTDIQRPGDVGPELAQKLTAGAFRHICDIVETDVEANGGNSPFAHRNHIWFYSEWMQAVGAAWAVTGFNSSLEVRTADTLINDVEWLKADPGASFVEMHERFVADLGSGKSEEFLLIDAVWEFGRANGTLQAS